MTRTSAKRHSRRAERRRRAAERPPAPTPEPAPAGRPRDIALTGLIGGLTGAIPVGARAVEILVSPGDLSRAWAIPLFVIAAVYLPAVWASVARVENRKRILRNVLALSLVLIVGVTILTGDPALAVLLLIPSTLLAIASGVIFQGPQPRK